MSMNLFQNFDLYVFFFAKSHSLNCYPVQYVLIFGMIISHPYSFFFPFCYCILNFYVNFIIRLVWPPWISLWKFDWTYPEFIYQFRDTWSIYNTMNVICFSKLTALSKSLINKVIQFFRNSLTCCCSCFIVRLLLFLLYLYIHPFTS